MICPGCYGNQKEGKSGEKMKPSNAKKIAVRTNMDMSVLVIDSSSAPELHWSSPYQLKCSFQRALPGQHPMSLFAMSTFFFFAFIMADTVWEHDCLLPFSTTV